MSSVEVQDTASAFVIEQTSSSSSPNGLVSQRSAGNEHLNGSPLPSKRTQICVPVCFKHLLRPHLAESEPSVELRRDSLARGQLVADSCSERQRKAGKRRRTDAEEEGQKEMVALEASLLLPEPLGSTFLF